MNVPSFLVEGFGHLKKDPDLDGWVFIDRGLIDAAAALQHLTGEPTLATVSEEHRFYRQVFLAPPCPKSM
jgi:predicted ATPase